MEAVKIDYSLGGTQCPNEDMESLKNITVGSQAVVSANYFISKDFISGLDPVASEISDNASNDMSPDIGFATGQFIKNYWSSLNRVEFNLSTIEPRKERKRQAFQRLQEWEGIVTQVNDKEETFTARLIDITNANNPEEETDFSIDELSTDDMKMLNEGALFRWVIGYDINNGTKRKLSQIIFRRLPQWTKTDIVEADKEAEELFSSLQWE